MTDRKIKVEKVNYEDSELLCNLKLIDETQHRGRVQSIGFTRGEAEEAYKQLGGALK